MMMEEYSDIERIPEFEKYEKQSKKFTELQKSQKSITNSILLKNHIDISKQKISSDIKKYVFELDKLRLASLENNSQIEKSEISQMQQNIKKSEKEKIIIEKADLEFVDMLEKVLNYLQAMDGREKNYKNINNSTQIRLRKIFDKIGKVVTEAKIKEDWIFKENQDINNFLGEYFGILFSLREDITELANRNFGICGGGSKKNKIKLINLKIDQLEYRFLGFKTLFRLKPRFTKVFKTYSGKREFIIPQPLVLDVNDLEDIIDMGLQNFPEFKEIEKTKIIYETKIEKVEVPIEIEKKVFTKPEIKYEKEKKSDFFVAQEYFLGIGKVKNIQKAIQNFEKAEKNGNTEASNILGKIYLNGIGVKKNYEKSYHHFKKSAQEHNPESLYYIGFMIEKGYIENLSQKKRILESYQYFKKSADLDFPEALTDLGFYYEKGLITKCDEKKAILLYKKSIGFNNARAMNNLASIYLTKKKNVEVFQKSAFELFKKSSDLGNKEALTNLAICYLEGIGTTKNFIIAHELFSQSAKNKDPDALFYLAFFKLKKIDTNSVKDYREIHHLLTEVLLINPEHADALYYTGYLYENGLGLELNYDKSIFYYKKSVNVSKEKNAKALYKLGIFYRKKNIGKSNYYLKKAAELGDSDAVNKLGENYEKEGRIKMAEEFYKTGLELGNKDAEVNLAILTIKKDFDNEDCKDFIKEAAEEGNEKARVFMGGCMDKENEEEFMLVKSFFKN